MQRFRDYDPFAWLYAHHWGDEFHRALSEPLDKAVLGKLKRGASLLDLCCGDGRLAEKLEQRGFEVTGLDGSQEMLTYARQRCPNAKFLLGDARDFKLEPQFDAVVCTFDSLNHVLEPKDLNRVFANVRACLKPGGIFVFDLNREEAYTKLWVLPAITVEDDVVSVAQADFDIKTGLASCDVTLLRKEKNCWKRSDFQLRQRLHDPGDVLDKLHKAGFEAFAQDAQELGMDGNFGFGRDFYIAKKSAR